MWNEDLHPREAGQFATKQGASSGTGSKPKQGMGARPKKKPAGGNLSFDGKRGPGYGVTGGDKRVRGLQEALNRLGLTDSSGKKLVVDGKLGPRTTAAIKKAQRQLGVKADGVVTPALLAQLTKAKALKKAAPAKKTAAPARKAVAPAKKAVPAKKATPVKARS